MLIKQQTIRSNNGVSAPERQQLSISHLTDLEKLQREKAEADWNREPSSY